MHKTPGCVKILHGIIVTESVKAGLIAHDTKFDFITQTQSLMNALSNIMATAVAEEGVKDPCSFLQFKNLI